MENFEELEKRIRRIEERLGIVNEYPYTFDAIADKLDRRTFEQIWQGLDPRQIAIALIGLNREQLLHIKPTLSKSRWDEISKELTSPATKEMTQSTVQNFRKGILDRMLRMESRGEIVVVHDREKLDYVLSRKTSQKEEEIPVDVQSWLQTTFEKV